jgi:Transposase IS4
VKLKLHLQLRVATIIAISGDNRHFFTSIRLLEHLGALGIGAIGATGTVRQNRTEGCPLRKSFKTLEKAERGATDYMLDKSSNVVVVAWKDNKVVTLGSNCVGVEYRAVHRDGIDN